MSKKLIITLAAILTIGTAVNVFAEAGVTTGAWSTTMGAVQTYGSTGRPTLDVKPSNGVFLWLSSTVDTGKSYLCASKHNTGTKGFGSASQETKIYMTDKTSAGAVTPPIAVISTTTPDWTGWTAM